MRRKEKQINDQAIINEIFRNTHICRLALHDQEYPYLVPLNYGYDGTHLYFHCALEGRKVDLIKKNNKVAFEIEEPYQLVKHEKSCNWSSKFSCIMGTGSIEIVEDANEKVKGLDVIMQHHGRAENQYVAKAVEKVLILKLNIQSLSAKRSLDWDK